MAILSQESVPNKVLSILPAADFALVAKHLEYIDLPQGTVLARVGEPIEFVYFLTSGIGSLVTTTPEGNRAEAGIFGFDGYVPTTAMAEVETSSHDVGMQVAGTAYRIDYPNFRVLMDSKNFSKAVIRSMEAFSIQLAHTAVSNAVHDVDERLARWLLMCHDRVSANEIGITHEFISIMLSVRRATVTTSLHTLESNGFIRAQRGMITIRNRSALEEFAHDAYGRPEAEYRRLMKDLFK
ncbi:Crp/Fnr family transcriptional regulator [Agrobacterium sp.]|jgi:CRP-like cAMP-binding protein|uniref:Crp/Fnr family transcriptional regulator n=1 Tax=Agrobacterium sp. TaxID=361 RepID=UPI0028AF8731|nr:Crp/Fnr family transcriptional regulator [Agrobacterium sp.]